MEVIPDLISAMVAFARRHIIPGATIYTEEPEARTVSNQDLTRSRK